MASCAASFISKGRKLFCFRFVFKFFQIFFLEKRYQLGSLSADGSSVHLTGGSAELGGAGYDYFVSIH